MTLTLNRETSYKDKNNKIIVGIFNHSKNYAIIVFQKPPGGQLYVRTDMRIILMIE